MTNGSGKAIFMKIGLQIPSFTWPGGAPVLGTQLAQVARAADDSGFASLWVMDHFFQIKAVGDYKEPMLESYAALNFMAAHTKRIRLGTLVTGVIYRNPGILVKTVTTLDVLSGGRAYLGIGAAWNEQESIGLGVEFPPIKERFEKLEETLQIALQMWSGKGAPYNGKHYQLKETLNSPQPISQPHPPILIGGMGERKTLKLVAQYANSCNFFEGVGEEILRNKLDILKEHCDQLGRPYENIEKSVLFSHRGITSRQLIEKCQSLAKLGINHVIINSIPNIHEALPIEAIGKEVIPEVSGI
jgi:F420-dependent oxidoreductase-like protein